MKIIFRGVPFTPAQQYTLTVLIENAGSTALWLSDDKPALDMLTEADALIGYFPPEYTAQLPNLKWLQLPCAGAERFCRAEYAASDVILTNCSGAFGAAIAEYCLTGLLSLMRLMPAYAQNQRSAVWKQLTGCRSVVGSTVTVIGAGDLGRNVAIRLKALGAHVRGVRRSSTISPDGFDEMYTPDRLCEAVAGVDAVIACLPGTPATTGVLSAEVISAMPTKAFFINCGRGYTVDQDALTDALQNGRLAGACLDVTEPEPLPADHPLWTLPNVIITPHISGRDTDPMNAELIYAIVQDNLGRWLRGEPLTHIVDRTVGY